MVNNELYCEVCQVQSTNLSAHYDHIHSKRHQKATGIIHKVERSTLTQVLSKLEELKQEHLKIMSGNGEPAHQHISFTERLEQESKRRREERKRKKLPIKEDPVLEDIEPEMLDSGFSFGSFSSSKRN